MALLEDDNVAIVQGGVMAGMQGYAQPLRAIGQALEVLEIHDFEMEPAGNDFCVKGSVPLTANKNLLKDQCRAEELGTIWGALPSADDQLGDKQKPCDLSPLSRIDLRYTAQDVERLEAEGRSRRGNFPETADAPSLSQVLRCMGTYLNQKRATLCKISREIDCYAIEYKTSLGSRMKETLAHNDIYDLWVRMYVQRAERTSH
jgi:hypothetical protein